MASVMVYARPKLRFSLVRSTLAAVGDFRIKTSAENL